MKKLCLAVLFISAAALPGCMQPVRVYNTYEPRRFEQVEEAAKWKRVWVHSGRSHDLSRGLQQIEATVGELLGKNCGLVMVKRGPQSSSRDIPAHDLRLQLDETRTSHSQNFGFGGRFSFQTYRVEAKMFLVTNDQYISSGVGRAAFPTGSYQEDRFLIFRGLLRGIEKELELFPASPDALEEALRQAFIGVCYRLKQQRIIVDPPSPRSGGTPDGSPVVQAVPQGIYDAVEGEGQKPVVTYHGSALCLPPTCFERRITAKAVGTVAVGVNSGGSSLTPRGLTVKSGKIVPIK